MVGEIGPKLNIPEQVAKNISSNNNNQTEIAKQEPQTVKIEDTISLADNKRWHRDLLFSAEVESSESLLSFASESRKHGVFPAAKLTGYYANLEKHFVFLSLHNQRVKALRALPPK
ncbi:MAG: hypothetical protein MK033_06010 [Candidatus Caenarcaniphilales bacterium]|nr:hypothetical protein [Candidatus Caenarcaniphilales bacterium]